MKFIHVPEVRVEKLEALVGAGYVYAALLTQATRTVPNQGPAERLYCGPHNEAQMRACSAQSNGF